MGWRCLRISGVAGRGGILSGMLLNLVMDERERETY